MPGSHSSSHHRHMRPCCHLDERLTGNGACHRYQRNDLSPMSPERTSLNHPNIGTIDGPEAAAPSTGSGQGASRSLLNRTCIPLPAARMTGTILPVVRRGGVMTEFHPARAEPAQADRQQVCGWSDGLADEHRVRLPRNRSHCFAVVVGHSLWPPVQSGVAGTLIGLSALGVLGASIFNSDLQGEEMTPHGVAHGIASLVSFVSIMPGMIVVSPLLRRANRLRGGYRVLTHLSWLVPVLFLAMHLLFAPRQLAELGQRLTLAAMFTWLLMAAYGIRTGALMRTDRASFGAEETS